MKLTHCPYHIMATLLSLIAAFFGVATAANVQSGSNSAGTSISQIQDTLRNLLRSIEDNGRDAEALFGKRQLWCDSAIHDFEAANDDSSASLGNMRAHLTEMQAEVEEAEGTVSQVKVDIEMVQHTVKQTEDMLKEHSGEGEQMSLTLLQTSSKDDTKLLTSLLENKRLSLTSLQEELQVSAPVLAQLQANVAETKQRVSYRTESLLAAKDFVSALKDGCQGAAKRADTQAAARVGESNSIHVALQALAASVQTQDDRQDEDIQDGDKILSFVQLADKSDEVTTDDLSDLFAADQVERKGSTLEQSKGSIRMEAVPSLRPHIQTLLTQLKTGAAANGLDQAAWCSKQRESSAMALKFAQDSLAQAKSQMDAHAAAEAELSEELEKLQTSAAAVAESGKTVLQEADKEKALIQSSQKDQVLAIKILDQAATILKEMGMSNSSMAFSGLGAARKMLAAQIKAATGFQQEATSKAKVVGEAAAALTKVQENEQHNLELARDDHSSQRLSGVSTQHLCEADLKEATAFAQKLEESCKSSAESVAEQQRSAQTHALEDAQQALDGKLLEAKSAAVKLRGVQQSSVKQASQNLTPMQRAAAEMGISTD